MYYDYHIHTKYSPDSNEELVNIIKIAENKGLKEICITDHVDFTNDGKVYKPNYEKFFKELNNINTKVKVKVGIELGIDYYQKNIINTFINDFELKDKFDFIIGSSHNINGEDIYINFHKLGDNDKNVYVSYFDSVLKNIKEFDCYDVYGHLDYIYRYKREKNSFKHSDYEEIIDCILKELVKKGKGIEINTSGSFYNINELHPNLETIKKYKQLGGEIITVGSDSHKAITLCNNFSIAYKYLKESGFQYICTFNKRKPNFVKI